MSYWDKYRNSHEPTEHWEMRKKFLEAHQKSYDEDRLLCLAQTFYNIEFLGCRYPEKVMKEIEVLSQGVADDHREAKKSKIQRTFVAASEAAESKVCRTGTKRKAEDNRKNPGVTIQGQTIHDVMRNQQRPTPQNTASGLDLRLIQKYLDREPPLSHLILLRMKTETDLNFEYLQRSAKISQVKALFHYDRSDGQIEATLRIVTSSKPFKVLPVVKTVMINPMNTISKTKKRTIKEKLLELAGPVLHRKHFCVVVNSQFYSSQSIVEKDEDDEKKEKVKERTEEDEIEDVEDIKADVKNITKRENNGVNEDLEKRNVEERKDDLIKDVIVTTGDINKTLKLEGTKIFANNPKDEFKKDLGDVRDKRYANFKQQLTSSNTKQGFDKQNTTRKYVSDDYEKLEENMRRRL